MAVTRTPCPRCGSVTEVDDAHPLPADYPFCSERCHLIDLGKWFDEEYRVSREVHEADLDQGE